jgi:hypothetical protein
MASAQPNVQITGIKEALAELNKIDPTFRREITKRIKGAGEQIISEARSMVASFDNSLGNGAPLSGMVRGNLIAGRETDWKTSKVQKGFKVKVGRAASRSRYVNFDRGGDTQQVVYGAKPYRLMVIQQTDAAGAIYDHAGRHTSSTFVSNLNAEVGDQPRAIDKAVEKGRVPVTLKVLEVVHDVEKVINRKLKVTYGN